MLVSQLSLLVSALLAASTERSVNALAIPRPDVAPDDRLWRRQGFDSLGQISAKGAGTDALGQLPAGSGPSTPPASSGENNATAYDTTTVVDAPSNDTDAADGDSADVDTDVSVIPLTNLVLPIRGAPQPAADQPQEYQNARRDGDSGLKLWYTTKGIRSANRTVLHGVRVDASSLRGALQEMQANAQAQPQVSSDHLRVDGGNLSMLIASAVSDPAQNITWTNVGQIVATLLQDMDGRADNVTSTYVGVIKDAQAQPLINIVVLPLFKELSLPTNGTAAVDSDPQAAEGGATGDQSVSTLLSSGPGRGLKGLSSNQIQTDGVPRTAMKIAYAPVALTAARSALDGLLRAASDTLADSRSMFTGYVNKLYFTSPGAGLALNVEVAGNENILKLDVTPAFKAIQHATWTAARVHPLPGGRTQALQGMIFTGTKALATWYFSNLPQSSEYGAAGSSATQSYVGITHEEL